MRSIYLAGVSGLLIATSALAQNAAPAAAGGRGPAGTNIAGTIESFDGKTLKIKATADGSVVSAALAPTATITFNAKKTLADIKPGMFIASGGTKGADGKISALEIRIFDAPRGEGQFPMAQPGQIMTNATVQQVMTNATVQQVNGSTGTIKLSFKGAGAPGSANCTGRAAEAPGGAGTGCTGQTEFEVPANVPIVQQQPGNVSMLKAGAKATMNVSMGADGVATASRVTVSE